MKATRALTPAHQPTPALTPAHQPTPALTPALTPRQVFVASVLAEVERLTTAKVPQCKAVAIVAATCCWPMGKRVGQPVGERTIHRWVKKGVPKRTSRADAGRRRVAVSRKWDAYAAAHGIGAEARAAIAERVAAEVTGEIQAAGLAAYQVARNVRPDLMEWTRAAASAPLDGGELARACTLPLDPIKARIAERVHNIRRTDAKRYSDTFEPRITRHRDGLRPMDWLAGDVHHLDLVLERTDGSTCCPSIVAWVDLATNRLWASLHIPAEREAVRREDVLESFADVAASDQWGIPAHVYLDNGGEYRAMDFAADMLALKAASNRPELANVRRADGVIKSRPYQPQAKVLESFFPHLESRYLSQLPGYIGGDRMNKRTHQVGAAPIAFGTGAEALQRALDVFLAEYHATPQEGHLAGLSPNQKFAECVAAGWESITFDRSESEVAFAQEITRTVDRGVIKWTRRAGQRQRYYSDALTPLSQRRVVVRAPVFGADVLYVFHRQPDGGRGKFITKAAPEDRFDFLGGAGDAERARRSEALATMLDAAESPIDRTDRLAITARATAAAHLADGAPVRAESAGQVSIADFADAAKADVELVSARPAPRQVDGGEPERALAEILAGGGES